MSNIVYYIIDKNVTTFTIDDGRVNAVSFQFTEEVNAAQGQSEKDQTEVMVTRPRKFSDELDLLVLTQGGDAAIRLTRLGTKLTVRLISFPTP